MTRSMSHSLGPISAHMMLVPPPTRRHKRNHTPHGFWRSKWTATKTQSSGPTSARQLSNAQVIVTGSILQSCVTHTILTSCLFLSFPPSWLFAWYPPICNMQWKMKAMKKPKRKEIKHFYYRDIITVHQFWVRDGKGKRKWTVKNGWKERERSMYRFLTWWFMVFFIIYVMHHIVMRKHATKITY